MITTMTTTITIMIMIMIISVVNKEEMMMVILDLMTITAVKRQDLQVETYPNAKRLKEKNKMNARTRIH